MQTVLECHADAADELRRAVRAEDFKTLAHLAHNLKGVTGNLEASTVYVQAGIVDEAARGALADRSQDGVRLACIAAENLADQMAVLLREIARHLSTEQGQ